MQDPLHINKQECDFTKIIVNFLRQFNFKDVELGYIDDLFKLTLRILKQSSNVEIIKNVIVYLIQLLFIYYKIMKYSKLL